MTMKQNDNENEEQQNTVETVSRTIKPNTSKGEAMKLMQTLISYFEGRKQFSPIESKPIPVELVKTRLKRITVRRGDK